ncbi:MAG: hypothetical protein PF572_06210 [Patescibacteria group bacterium]|jgi:hypothetical protein|nr:hypothetical protein [Patescibacteria group bacterium]
MKNQPLDLLIVCSCRKVLGCKSNTEKRTCSECSKKKCYSGRYLSVEEEEVLGKSSMLTFGLCSDCAKETAKVMVFEGKTLGPFLLALVAQ